MTLVRVQRQIVVVRSFFDHRQHSRAAPRRKSKQTQLMSSSINYQLTQIDSSEKNPISFMDVLTSRSSQSESREPAKTIINLTIVIGGSIYAYFYSSQIDFENSTYSRTPIPIEKSQNVTTSKTGFLPFSTISRTPIPIGKSQIPIEKSQIPIEKGQNITKSSTSLSTANNSISNSNRYGTMVEF